MERASFLSVGALLAILALMVHEARGAETITKNLTLTTGRNTELSVNFKALMGADYPPGAVVTILELPKFGNLAGNRRNPVEVGGNTENNQFYYTSYPDFPSDGIKVSIDRFKYQVNTQADLPYQSGYVNVRVELRQLRIKNYTLTSIDATTPRVLELRVRDGSRLLTLKDRTLASVQIETLPNGGCFLKQFDNTAIVSEDTKITDIKLQVYVFPAPSMKVGDSCVFSYSATRSNGMKTPPSFVTLTQYAPRNFVPRAYYTNTVYNVDFDSPRMLELVGSTRNPNSNLTFILTKLPELGQVYDAAETTTEALPMFGFNQSDLPLTLYTGPKTRVVLVYQVNPKLVGPNGTTVTVEYIVKDKFQTSAPAKVTVRLVRKGSPKCGSVVITPVFWDRPVKDILLNFTNPNARREQKLVLLNAPTKPIGDLLYTRATIIRERKIRLLPGSYFSDRDNRLSYQVKPSMRSVSGNETYSFRVQNFDGMSCIGTVTFVVMQHDAPIVPSAGLNIRREVVRLDSWNLLPLWGTANKTVAKPSSAIISQGPNFGTLYQLMENAPYDKGRMYRVNLLGLARPYCVRHNCLDYRGERIDVGDKVVRKELWADDDSLNSATRFFVLYQAPKSLPQGMTLNTFTDTFEYHFFNTAGEKSEVQRVTIAFRNRKKRVIICRYKANDERNYNFDHQKQTFIKCAISNETNQAVMIPEFDKYRRHGAQVNFRLFQYRQDGNRIYTGDRLANTTRASIIGQWLDNQNTVIVVPSARARRQIFNFRAIIYNTSDTGAILSSVEPEMVRVTVVRENTPPVWVIEEVTGQGTLETTTALLQTIDITAYDADDDLLQFRLAQGVNKGVLYYEDTRFGANTMSIVKTGAVLRIPKGAVSRGTARLYYKVDSRAGWTYPQYDTFTLYADDGGGVLSPPLIFNITITGDENTHSAQGKTLTVSYGTIVLALLTVVATVLLALAAVLRRKGRNKYMSLPTDQEMQPGPSRIGSGKPGAF